MFDRLARSAAAARELIVETGAKLLDAETTDCMASRSTVVDTVSENLVQDALNKLMIGRTSLVISNRLSTIQKAYKIT